MVVRCSVHLHGEAADAAGAVVTRCSVHEPLTYEALRAVYPFAGRFHFRVRRNLEGEDVWYDVREGEAIELDDPKRCEIRALCVDFDDDRWDGPAARGAADDDDEWDDEYIELLEEMMCHDHSNANELRDMKKNNEAKRNKKLMARKKAAGDAQKTDKEATAAAKRDKIKGDQIKRKKHADVRAGCRRWKPKGVKTDPPDPAGGCRRTS